MRATLQGASGVVVSVQVKRANSVYQNRKPWNRQRVCERVGGKAEERSFYLPQGSCADIRREVSSGDF